MEKREKKVENNLGFSLVELIIVIVIMVILIGIIGTQVIPYIQKAQKARDIQQVSAYCTDAMTAYASCASKLDETTFYTISVTKNGSAWSVNAKDSSGAACTVLKDEFLDLTSIETNAPRFDSKEGQKIHTITIVCQNGKPSVSLTVSGPKDPAAFAAEAK